jgi:hypothetical protein
METPMIVVVFVVIVSGRKYREITTAYCIIDKKTVASRTFGDGS